MLLLADQEGVRVITENNLDQRIINKSIISLDCLSLPSVCSLGVYLVLGCCTLQLSAQQPPESSPPPTQEIALEVPAGQPDRKLMGVRTLHPAIFSFGGGMMEVSSPGQSSLSTREGVDLASRRSDPAPLREIPQNRQWRELVFETPADLILLERRNAPSKSGLLRAGEASHGLRLDGGRRNVNGSAFTTQPLPVNPDTRLSCRFYMKGDGRIQFEELDSEGRVIGAQWSNPAYFSAGDFATYIVKTSPLTHWLVIQIDNPGFEESRLLSVQVRHGSGINSPKSKFQ